MATVYKTPGVYIEEIPKLPPSIAQVETAIPAFIGYTEKAEDVSPDDLLNKPKRIGSLVEYQLYYGGGPSPNVVRVNIDSSNNFVSADVSNTFFLYDSLQMFFANGGGDCYIVSVGKYLATISDSALKSGISALEKEDEPTILLFPDAVTLTDSALAGVQQAALAQCELLQDRVSVFDLKKGDPKGAAFRGNIGINSLKYGMAYTPWLKVNLPKTIKFPNVKSVIHRSGILVALNGLTTDVNVQNLILDLDKAYADLNLISVRTKVLSSPDGNLSTGFQAKEADFNQNPGDQELEAIYAYVYSIAAQIDRFISASPDQLSLSTLSADVVAAVSSTFSTIFMAIVALETETDTKLTSGYSLNVIGTTFTNPAWVNVTGGTSNLITESNDPDRRTSSLNHLRPLFDQLNQAYLNLIVKAAASYSKTLDASLALQFPVYKKVLDGVSSSMTTIPPSGAVVGIYALVDRTRGVWKAPANVSISNVTGPEVTFTNSELDALNVHAVSGKSINAIRAFTGKGTLVFGARTLAGNDNEWRYVNVRRFFNMVEESTKKATEPFVFEPNDANTWVKVQAMIENFLFNLWRQGALQGAKPEHAFYVAVGLGKTMTAVDILEGRMIIEIGMAVVRPAEFIILKFSHKMAES